MSRTIQIADAVVEKLNIIRNKFADDGDLISYSKAIKKLMRAYEKKHGEIKDE